MGAFREWVILVGSRVRVALGTPVAPLDIEDKTLTVVRAPPPAEIDAPDVGGVVRPARVSVIKN